MASTLACMPAVKPSVSFRRTHVRVAGLKATPAVRVANRCIAVRASGRQEENAMKSGIDTIKAAALGICLSAAPLAAHADNYYYSDDAALLPAWAGLLGGLALVYGTLNSRLAKVEKPKSATGMAPVTEAEVLDVQKNWAAAIAHISKTYKDGGDYIGEAGKAAGELYAYGHSNVLFKPTKAAEYPFRPTAGEAMSYFVGGSVVDNGYAEDGGFAINGGKGWASCVYKNHQVELKGGNGVAMGTYDFTCATTGDVSTVEYTFGYTRCDDGKVRIYLHHSSVPYSA